MPTLKCGQALQYKANRLISGKAAGEVNGNEGLTHKARKMAQGDSDPVSNNQNTAARL